MNSAIVKSRPRFSPVLARALELQKEKAALAADPLLKLSEAATMIGNPSYPTLRRWIATGKLRVWRAGNSHFKVKLSEVRRFLRAGEYTPAPESDAGVCDAS